VHGPKKEEADLSRIADEKEREQQRSREQHEARQVALRIHARPERAEQQEQQSRQEYRKCATARPR